MKHLNLTASIFFGAFLATSTAWAEPDCPTLPGTQLTPPVGLSSIPFNFFPPGARALGMGGTFLAIADDATASEANPAGLTILTRPEVSVHGRSSSVDLETVDVNAQTAVNNIVSFRGFLRDFEANTGVAVNDPAFIPPSTNVTLGESASDASFISFVYPFKKFTVSIYRQQVSNFEGSSSFSVDDDAFIDFYTTRKRADLTFESIGASFGVKLGKLVSFGVSVRNSTLDLNTLDEFRVDYFQDFENPFVFDFAAFAFDINPNPNLNFTDFITVRETLAGDDEDVTINAGLLLNANGILSAGLVYKEGGEYTISRRLEGITCIDFNGPGLTCESGNPFFFDRTLLDQDPRTIKIPDFFGIGLALRPTDRLTVALDVNRITYSDLQPPPEDTLAQVGENINDGVEFHLGLEYTFLARGGKSPISLRTGFWTEEDHDGFVTVDSEQTHYTLGLGFVVKSLQIDVAGHFSDTVDEGLLSLVYRF